MAGKPKAQKASGLKLDTVARVILYVKDTERSARFYSQTLGIPVKYADEGWIEFDTKGTPVCLHSGRTKRAGDSEAAVSFQVKDFDAAYRALKVREVEGLTEPHSPCGGLRYASFRDLDGNVLSIEGR
jgi:predicted enzyme related to lactoylglutathione lyase